MNTGNTGKTAGDDIAANALPTLSEEEALELTRVFVRMPYGGSLQLRHVKTVDDVLHNLEVLEQLLEDLSAEAEAMRSELTLWKIRKQVMRDLAGEILGLGSKDGAPE